MSDSWEPVNKQDWHDLVSMVLVYAPDFPEEDYLEPHEQLTLKMAFAALRTGLKHFAPVRRDSSLRARVVGLLNQAEKAYREDRILDAGTVMQEVDDILRGSKTPTLH